jgi:hypothetical protein
MVRKYTGRKLALDNIASQVASICIIFSPILGFIAECFDEGFTHIKHTHTQHCICSKCAEEGKYKKGYVKPLPKVVEEKKQQLEEQWEEVDEMCRSLELHRNTVSACGVGKTIMNKNIRIYISIVFVIRNCIYFQM